MFNTVQDEHVNSLYFCSGTQTRFKYERGDLLQLTEVLTDSTTAAEMLPPAPGSHFQSSNSDNAYL